MPSETEGLQESGFAFHDFLALAAVPRNEMQIILRDSQCQYQWTGVMLEMISS